MFYGIYLLVKIFFPSFFFLTILKLTERPKYFGYCSLVKRNFNSLETGGFGGKTWI